MNRRMLLKGTAATGSGLLLANRLGASISLAQAPSYTAEVIYEFTDFATDEYSSSADGGFSAVSPDGIIVGWDWVDGVLAPVTWDLTGARTPLDTGDIQYARSWFIEAGANGYLAGYLAETEEDDSPYIGVLWANGVPTQLDAGGGRRVYPSAVNGNGVVGGHVDGVPTRWIDGKLEQCPVPDGAIKAFVSAVAENGDGYGYSYDANFHIDSLFRWTADGSVQPIEFPSEVTANSLEKVNLPTFAGVFENGDFVLALSWVDAAGPAAGSWIYEQGTPQAVASSAEDTFAQVSLASNPADMFGMMNRGETSPSGFTGQTRWIDGVPYALQDSVALPGDVTSFSVRGVTAGGVIVASTYVHSDTPNPAYILALHPSI